MGVFPVDLSGQSVAIQYEMIDDHEQMMMDFLFEILVSKFFHKKLDKKVLILLFFLLI